VTEIEQLRRDILREYATSVGLPASAHYISGAPLRPVVPLDVGSEVFIIGAYPSARFGVMSGERDVPMADNLGPFEKERYYDGERVRVQDSARELEENYLTPLGVDRKNCWVTDLVKVFLFKKGHAEKYGRLGAQPPAGYYEREKVFETLGEKSIPWLVRELKLSKPKLVITLGREVAGIITGTSGDAARNKLLSGDVKRIRIGDVEVDVAHLPHPGVVMREAKNADETSNRWPELNKQFVRQLAAWLRAQKS
jgi:uracil-DNA glycosylase